jgi:hypothetical protein
MTCKSVDDGARRLGLATLLGLIEQRAAEMGIKHVLRKPFTIAVLLGVLRGGYWKMKVVRRDPKGNSAVIRWVTCRRPESTHNPTTVIVRT